MLRIVSDTSTMYSTTQAREAGFDVSPLSVTIGGESYREYDEIDAQRFVGLIQQGNMPTSSQPALGMVAALYEKYPGDEILNITMADGLSGTYQSAMAATELCPNPERVTVINSRTLCGPHRYMVEKAVELARGGKSRQEILDWLEQRIRTARSYLVPADFDYLRRGGRLSPLVSHVGKITHMTPVMTQTEDGCRLTVASIRRGFSHAAKYMAHSLHKYGLDQSWRVYVSHACAREKAEQAVSAMKALMPDVHYEIMELSPAFITQGGPGCVSVQCVEA